MDYNPWRRATRLCTNPNPTSQKPAGKAMSSFIKTMRLNIIYPEILEPLQNRSFIMSIPIVQQKKEVSIDLERRGLARLCSSVRQILIPVLDYRTVLPWIVQVFSIWKSFFIFIYCGCFGNPKKVTFLILPLSGQIIVGYYYYCLLYLLSVLLLLLLLTTACLLRTQ